ncbi:MAG TPA: histidinol-phosphate transaminase [Methanocorpusculum sp.]|nr:histidinol-phosphate transaminase [Methanocorpusculum sp.]
MSRFFTSRLSGLKPYTPGEQPQDMQYVKLNTNESPYPPSPKALQYARDAADTLMLYPDPEYKLLCAKLAEVYDVAPNQIVVGNGSDEILDFAFAAFCENGVVFPDTSYGFYSVFGELNQITTEEIPVRSDLSIDPADYCNVGRTIFLANPNAPSGIALSIPELERIITANPDSVVVIDEAYVDFGAESAVPLTKKYENVLVVQTFSKSRSLAGARFGFGVGSPELIADLNRIRYSTNPYNVSRTSAAAALGALEDEMITRANCAKIIATRKRTAEALAALGFTGPVSSTNFLFVKNDKISGKELYLKLKARGVLVRHFDKESITDYNRITVGTDEQMDILLKTVKEILEENA